MLRNKIFVVTLSAAVLMACRPASLAQRPPDAPTRNPSHTATPAPDVQPDEPAAARNMRVLLHQWLGEPGEAARLTSIRQAEWPDACFGAAYAGEFCMQVITPGYEMTFDVGGQAYTFRTDPEAYRYRLVAAPEPRIGETMAIWTGSNEAEVDSCAAAEIGTQALAFGDCGGLQIAGRLVNEANRQQLASLADRFVSFTADTPAGKVTLAGRGDQAAAPAEQRAVAELARLMFQEARMGRAAASWATAIALVRDAAPDRAAVCATVDVTGRVAVTDCQPNGAMKQVMLNSGGMEQLYRWLDQWQPFDFKVTEKDVATQVVFAGRGAQEASGADQQAVLAFAEGLIAESRAGEPRAGMVRYALPLILPPGLDWDPAQSEADDRRFRARAADPSSASRWIEIQGTLDEAARPAEAGTAVELRGQPGTAYDLPEGCAIVWKEEGTSYVVSGSFSLSETLEIASTLHPLELEEFEQLMRERARAGAPGS